MTEATQDVTGAPSSASEEPSHSGHPSSDPRGPAGSSAPPRDSFDTEGVRRRVNELNERYRLADERNRELERQLNELRDSDRKRMDTIASAFGVNREDPQAAALREELISVLGINPKALTVLQEEGRLDKLLALEAKLPEFEQFRDHYFGSMGSDVLREVEREIAEEYGVESLDPDKSNIARQLYTSWIEQRPDRVQRYTMRDPSLVKEYRAWYRANFADPFRRGAVVEQQQRVQGARKAVPGGDGGAVARTSAEPPAGDIEARAKLAFQRLASDKISR